MFAAAGFALLAGLLSTLSPCVVPVLPLVLGAAASAHKAGPLALAGGVALAFTALGLFAATLGFSLGLNLGAFRLLAAALLLALGLLLLIPRAQTWLATAAGPFGNWMNSRFGGRTGTGWRGQFGIGLLLGSIWTPCAGPTLGAATLLAAQGRDFTQVLAVMLAFGIGTALPLLGLGILSRATLQRLRGGMMEAGRTGKALLGGGLVAVSLLMLTGLDHPLETLLTNASPAWLTSVTARF